MTLAGDTPAGADFDQSPEPATLRLSDGRELTWWEVGDPSGSAVLHLHGANSSRLEIARLHHAARAAGVRLIAMDRPGYGGTTDRVMRVPGDVADDLAQLADALGIESFVVSGLSAGGMFALATAHSLGERVSRVVAINTAPPLADGVVGAAAPRQLRFAAGLARRAPRAMGWFLRRTGPKEGETTDQTIARIRRQTPADADMFTEDLEAFHLSRAAAQAGRTQGPSAPVRDFALAGTPWGFDPRRLACDVIVVNGREDPLSTAGRTLAGEIDGASFVEIPGGHLSVYHRDALTVLAELMAHGAGTIE